MWIPRRKCTRTRPVACRLSTQSPCTQVASAQPTPNESKSSPTSHAVRCHRGARPTTSRNQGDACTPRVIARRVPGPTRACFQGVGEYDAGLPCRAGTRSAVRVTSCREAPAPATCRNGSVRAPSTRRCLRLANAFSNTSTAVRTEPAPSPTGKRAGTGCSANQACMRCTAIFDCAPTAESCSQTASHWAAADSSRAVASEKRRCAASTRPRRS